MGKQLFANNAATTLAAPCSDVATSLTLVDGSDFPSPSGGDWFLLTLYQLSGATETNFEIMKVTARSSNVITVVRAYEDATRFPARSYTAGDFAELRATAGSLGLASNVTNVPAGNIAATDVQAAIAELDAEKQPLDAELSALAGLTSAADKLPYFTGSGTAAVTTFTSAGRALVDDADAAAQRTTLGLGTVATLASTTSTALAGNSDSNVPTEKAVKTYVDNSVTGLLDFKGSTDASGTPNYPAASKGDAYVVSVAGKIGGASGTSVDIGDAYVASADNAGGTQASVGASWFVLEHNLVGALLASNNLSELTSQSTARSNLGLGTLATQSGTFSGTSSGTNTGDETTTTTGALINGATGKTTPVDADYVGLMDSAAANVLKKLSWANVKATLKTYFDAIYAATSALGTAAYLNVGTGASQVVQLNGSSQLPAVSGALLTNLPSSGAIPFLYGDGSDGDVTVSGSTTLTRDMFYHNLTLSGSAAINTAGYRIFCSGTLDISAAPAGAIFWNGATGSDGTAGGTSGGNGATGLTAANLGGSGNGTAGGAGGAINNSGSNSTAATAATTNNGGATSKNGGTGGSAGQPGGTGVASSAVTYKAQMFPFLPLGLYMFTATTFSTITGGQGGGGAGGGSGGPSTTHGSSGGGGGAGGGVLAILANIIARGTNATAGIIQAKGGNGGTVANRSGDSGCGGGGAGGGGGWISIVFGTRTGSAITGAIDISGGNGGIGGTSTGTGVGGNGGGSGDSGHIDMYDMGAGTLTLTTTVAGSNGTAGSGVTGGAGATNTKQVNL